MLGSMRITRDQQVLRLVRRLGIVRPRDVREHGLPARRSGGLRGAACSSSAAAAFMRPPATNLPNITALPRRRSGFRMA